MSDDPFGKWWPCLRKHYKRTYIWLPRARELHSELAGGRTFRYFTLCARPMIDVYMLVREQILPVDDTAKRVRGVSFCECNSDVFPEMLELIGIEESGFLAKLEELVLHQDTPETETLDSEESLTRYLEEQGEGLDFAIRERVEGKRRHLVFRELFPFDFLNLDFCDRYYGSPPDVMKIHATIDKILEWQRRPNTADGGKEFSVKRFVAAITCRVDLNTPPDAVSRLKDLVTRNSAEYPEYSQAVRQRAATGLDQWAREFPLDFFMAAWPKEIARLAKLKSWDIAIRDHAFYERQNDEGETYHMVSLVVEFIQAPICDTYLTAVTRCLDPNARTAIPRFDPESGDGIALISDLREIVDLRNSQATRVAREPLPEPRAEIARLQSAGVPI